MSSPVGFVLVPAHRWLAAAVAVAALLATGCTKDENSQEPEPVRDDEGQVLDSTEVQALRVQVGDCFSGTIPFQVEAIEVVPCTTPHDHQAYAVFDLDPTPDPAPTTTVAPAPGAEPTTTSSSSTSTTLALADEPYPGSVRVQELGERGCLIAFGSYVGNAYEASALEIGLILPTEDSWNDVDDREVVCTAHRIDGVQLTASVEGSGL